MYCCFPCEKMLVILLLLHCVLSRHIGHHSISKEEAEEEQFTAILTLMEILTNLLSKDFLSFAAGVIMNAFDDC